MSGQDNRKTYLTVAGVLTLLAGGTFWYFNSNKKKRAQHLLLCGAPGSGKGTQCEKLIAKYNYAHISTGDILRQAVKDGTSLGLQAKAHMDAGGLVPDQLVIDVVKERLDSSDVKARGWILDGFPRTKPQAQALTAAGAMPDKVIVLDVPDEVLVERITGRRLDTETGKIYHLKFNPPPPEIEGRLVHRADDTKEKLVKRLEEYHKNIDLILDHYQNKTSLARIDGTKPSESVFRQIDEELFKLKI